MLLWVYWYKKKRLDYKEIPYDWRDSIGGNNATSLEVSTTDVGKVICVRAEELLAVFRRLPV